MTFTFIGKKFEVTDEIRAYAEKKIGKIDRMFRRESEARVTFSRERGRCLAEVTLQNNGMFYRASEVANDMRDSIDVACESIERQIRKNKTRLEKKLREGAFERTVEVSLPVEGEEEEEEEEEPEFKIVREKKFSIKPMMPEEAILQMNLLGHEFFAFRNMEDDGGFAIVYKRNNGGYGLISASDTED